MILQTEFNTGLYNVPLVKESQALTIMNTHTKQRYKLFIMSFNLRISQDILEKD